MNYRLFTSVRKIYYLCILNSNYYAGILERSELNSLINFCLATEHSNKKYF